MQLGELTKRFTYHAPQPDQIKRYEKIREWALNFACMLVEATPESREQSLAITALEECVSWANAAIARNEHQAEGEGGLIDGQ